MPGSSEEPVLRRKRVARACEICRSMKSKCDGRRPVCGRCKGYGYKCSYSGSGRGKYDRPTEDISVTSPAHAADTIFNFLREEINGYGELIQEISPALPDSERKRALDYVSSVNQRVESYLADVKPIVSAEQLSNSQSRNSADSQRYLGEVSDVKFFNLIKRVLQKDNPSRADDDMDSYEQDDLITNCVSARFISTDLPSEESAEAYLNIYFSTIHIAYPFIPKGAFLRMYNRVRETGAIEDIDVTLLATLNVVFAIGAYYLSFPGNETNSLHEEFFRRASALSSVDSMERSVNQVSFLLAKCFYLLAVCKTDRCWTTLGLAIRIAQSIGLHVEIDDAKTIQGKAAVKAEIGRRIWYSLYVLDRLLSLQLGRPPAIHDEDCPLSLPSRFEDTGIDWEEENSYPVLSDGPSTGDYFLSVIALSKIIGYVLRDLYGPHRTKRVTDGLASTIAVDKQLLEWKRNLPRTLRFDFGHAFEMSISFKRQRNMLAIKFHHLRALIHRPYLCLSLLKRVDNDPSTQLEGQEHIIDRYEKICVSEAQETAHMLHNITDEKDLVHDFPWWQMIPCLICASSILLVAGIFARHAGLTDDHIDITALTDDAETCMKVFEALSARSNGARIARDMMARLRERGEQWNPSSEDAQHLQPATSFQAQQLDTTLVQMSHEPPLFDQEFGFGGSMFSQDWPSEIVDSMAWSAQFLGQANGSAYNPFT